MADSTLKIKLNTIYQEKQNKILPENIKKDVQIFDVIGTYAGNNVEVNTKDLIVKSSFQGKTNTLENSVEGGLIEEFKVIGDSIQNGTPTADTSVAIEPVSGDLKIQVTNGTDTQEVKFALGTQLLRRGDYLADDGIHITRTTIPISINGGAITLSNGNVAGVFNISGKIYNTVGVVAEKAVYAGRSSDKFMQENTCYENPANVVIIGNSTDTLETLKAKFDGSIIEYTLATEQVVAYNSEQQTAWDKLKILTSYAGSTTVTTSNNIKPTLSGTYYKITDTMGKGTFKGENTILAHTIGNSAIEDFMITGNSIQDGVPTVTTPIEIQNVSGNIEVKLTNGIELFDKNGEDGYLYKTTKTILENGIRSIVTEVDTNGYNTILLANSDKLLGKTITLSCKMQPSASNYGAIRIYQVNSSGLPVGGSLLTLNINGAKSATLPSEYSSGGIQFGLIFSSNFGSETVAIGDFVDYTDIQLREGQIVTFPLDSQLLSEGSYIDDDGIHIFEKQQILTGTEDIGNYRTDTSTGYCSFSFAGTYTHIGEKPWIPPLYNKCNYFRNDDAPWANNREGMWFPDENQYIYFTVPVSLLADYSTNSAQVTSVKSWLADLYAAGNPVIIQVRLVNEELIPFTTTQQEAWNNIKQLATTYNGTNTITTTNEIKPILSGKYYMDVPQLPLKIKNINGTVQVNFKGGNLIDPDTISVGVFIKDTGEIGESSNNILSDFVPVSNKTYSFSAYDTDGNRIERAYQYAIYDETQTFITRYTDVSYNTPFTITDATVKYIRIWQDVASGESKPELLKLEEGVIVTDYNEQTAINNIELTEPQSIVITSSTEGEVIQATALTVTPSTEKQVFDDLYSTVTVEAVNYEESGTITPEEYTEAQTQINDLFGEEVSE